MSKQKEQTKIKNRIVFFDMDGVLVNFRKGAKELGIKFKGYSFINEEEAWAKIREKGYKFWTNLEWMKGAKELFEYACSKFDRVEVLSARSMDASSVIGKRIWCKQLKEIAEKYNTKFKANIVWISQKSKFSKNGKYKNILIDDYKLNLDNWNGDSILFKSAKQAKIELIRLEESYVKRYASS